MPAASNSKENKSDENEEIDRNLLFIVTFFSTGVEPSDSHRPQKSLCLFFRQGLAGAHCMDWASHKL